MTDVAYYRGVGINMHSWVLYILMNFTELLPSWRSAGNHPSIPYLSYRYFIQTWWVRNHKHIILHKGIRNINICDGDSHQTVECLKNTSKKTYWLLRTVLLIFNVELDPSSLQFLPNTSLKKQVGISLEANAGFEECIERIALPAQAVDDISTRLDQGCLAHVGKKR